mgnify:FL=1
MINIKPINQTKLFGLDRYMSELVFLKDNLPNKILLSGPKGVGKSTMALHFINYILSKDEEFKYDIDNYEINPKNHSFIITLNESNPNLYTLNVNQETKTININQIRDLISSLNKSSFNKKSRFVLIDNVEYLNVNSVNALLKIIEEPSENIFFILINNDKKVIPTLKSRCLNFRISLSNRECIDVSNKLLNGDIFDYVNEDLLNYYFTPGKILNLIKFSEDNSINLKKIELKQFLSLIIDKAYYKKENPIKFMIYDFFELYFRKKTNFKENEFYHLFLNQIENIKKFNLDEESLFIEFKQRLLNE